MQDKKPHSLATAMVAGSVGLGALMSTSALAQLPPQRQGVWAPLGPKVTQDPCCAGAVALALGGAVAVRAARRKPQGEIDEAAENIAKGREAEWRRQRQDTSVRKSQGHDGSGPSCG